MVIVSWEYRKLVREDKLRKQIRREVIGTLKEELRREIREEEAMFTKQILSDYSYDEGNGFTIDIPWCDVPMADDSDVVQVGV